MCRSVMTCVIVVEGLECVMYETLEQTTSGASQAEGGYAKLRRKGGSTAPTIGTGGSLSPERDQDGLICEVLQLKYV